MLLARAEGGVVDVRLKPWQIDFEQFIEAVAAPQIGTKDGAYFIRGGKFNGSTERADHNLLSADLIVLDGDSTVDMLEGTIRKGAPEPSLVHEVLKFADIAHCIYTSHSNTANSFRYRVCIPCPLNSQAELAAAVDWLINLLHQNRVMLAPVSENYRWSQPWYLPRVPEETAALFRHYKHDVDEPFPLAAALAWHQEQARTDAPEVEPAGSTARDPDSPIGRFVTEHGVEWMAALLEEHGYVLARVRSTESGLSYRFLAPRSQSGAPGLNLFRTDEGKWVVYSHHGADDVLSAGLHRNKALDAFDLFTHLVHHGDESAALDAAMAEQLASALDGLEPDTEILDPAAPLVSARRLVARSFTQDGLRVLQHHDGDFYAWAGTHYRAWPEAAARAKVYRFLASARIKAKSRLMPFHPNRNRVSDVLDALRAVAHLDSTRQPPCWADSSTDDPAQLMACGNGLLHLDSRTLRPPTPALFTLAARPFDYQPDAQAPRWVQFMDEVWPGDRQAIDTLQEMAGYLLGGATDQQKMFLIVGPRRSGKGTIARILRALVGHENTCGPTLASIGGNFGLQPLLHKQLALISDARLGGKTDNSVVVERLLSISGEDALSVDRKFREAVTLQLGVRFVVLTNELPRLGDASGALASRFVVLTMKRSFYGNEDPGLTAKLLAELPGILNWSLDGLDRLRQRGYFVQPDSALEAIAQLEELTSPIGAFIRETCEVGPHCTATLDQLYLTWQAWCQREGREHPGTKQTFARDLRAALPSLLVERQREDGSMGDRRRYVYHGLRLMPD